MKLFTITLLIFFSLINSELMSQNSTKTISQQDSIKESVTFEKQPLMIFDDKIIKSKKELNSINPNIIQELTVYKNDLDKFVNEYGAKAKNGVVFIYSKHYIANRWFNKFAVFNKRLQKRILEKKINYTDYKIYLNKVPLEINFFNGLEKKMDSMTIKKVKFKKSKSSKKGGLILIKTKAIKH